MPITIIEFKAKHPDIKAAEAKLLTLNPLFKGEDHQIDTYFNVTQGRLKLREGNIENALIYYERENTASAKQSNVQLYKHTPDKSLKELLIKLHGIKAIVDKTRRIYFIDNVKLHFDRVDGLGEFIEVEAIDDTGVISVEKLQEQCARYIEFFGVAEGDFMKESYGEMVTQVTKAADLPE